MDFLAMELVEGETLRERIGRGALAEKELLALAAQVAAAIEEAHEQGLLHRDLKPANIMVTPKGQAKVLDFGIAKLVRPVGEMTAAETLGDTQALAGTLPYMAPEQLRGEPAPMPAPTSTRWERWFTRWLLGGGPSPSGKARRRSFVLTTRCAKRIGFVSHPLGVHLRGLLIVVRPASRQMTADPGRFEGKR